jgi:hypothetical protein
MQLEVQPLEDVGKIVLASAKYRIRLLTCCKVPPVLEYGPDRGYLLEVGAKVEGNHKRIRWRPSYYT